MRVCKVRGDKLLLSLLSLLLLCGKAAFDPHSCRLQHMVTMSRFVFTSTDSAERSGLLVGHAEVAEPHPAAGVQPESNVLGE